MFIIRKITTRSSIVEKKVYKNTDITWRENVMVTGSKEILLKEALQAAKLTSKQENNFWLFIHTLCGFIEKFGGR